MPSFEVEILFIICLLWDLRSECSYSGSLARHTNNQTRLSAMEIVTVAVLSCRNTTRENEYKCSAPEVTVNIL